jgi:hypothetical protein
MNSRLKEIAKELENTRLSLHNTVSDLTQEQLDKEPEPGKWSAGEIIHHIYIVEKGITRLIAKQLGKAAQKGIGPDAETGSLIDSLDEFEIETVKTKVKAPAQSQPEKGVKKEELLKLLAEARKELENIYPEAGKFDLTQIIFPHPILGRINLYQWILFIAKHEERHINQIIKVIETVNKNN